MTNKPINWQEELSKEYLFYLIKHAILFSLFLLFMFYSIQQYTDNYTECSIEYPIGTTYFKKTELYQHVPTTYDLWGVRKIYNLQELEYPLRCSLQLPKQKGEYTTLNFGVN